VTAYRVHVSQVRVRGLPEAPAPAALAGRVEAEVARALAAGPSADPGAAIASAVRAAVGSSAPEPRAAR
jgi:hypothetical protein